MLIFALFLSTLSTLTLALDVPWETLKTLELDSKTKKNIIKPELKKVLGTEIKMKGFMMPLDFEAKEIVEFLFMPYVPACMHVPPPPANQLILVTLKKGIKMKPSFYPIEITGKLSVAPSAELESSYKFESTKVTEIKDYTPPTTPAPNVAPGTSHTN